MLGISGVWTCSGQKGVRSHFLFQVMLARISYGSLVCLFRFKHGLDILSNIIFDTHFNARKCRCYNRAGYKNRILSFDHLS